MGDKMKVDLRAHFIKLENRRNLRCVRVEAQETIKHRFIGLLIQRTFPIHNTIISVGKDGIYLFAPLLDEVSIVPVHGKKA